MAFDLEKFTKKGSAVLGGITSMAEGFALNNTLENVGDYQSEIDSMAAYAPSTGNLDNLQSAWNSHMMSTPNISARDIRGATPGQQAASILGSAGSGALAGATFGGVGAIVGGAVGLGAGLAGKFSGDAKAKREAAALNQRADLANRTIYNNLVNAAETTHDMMFNNSLAYRNAYGGPLKFSGDFTNGITFINEGGTHEENPQGGVMLSVTPEGIPNLAEEGEVVYNDYIYSNRLSPTEEQLKEFKLDSKLKGKTFAEIAKKLQEESEENPNDAISKRGLQEMMGRLTGLHEYVRQIEEQRLAQESQGLLGNMFWDGGLQYLQNFRPSYINPNIMSEWNPTWTEDDKKGVTQDAYKRYVEEMEKRHQEDLEAIKKKSEEYAAIQEKELEKLFEEEYKKDQENTQNYLDSEFQSTLANLMFEQNEQLRKEKDKMNDVLRYFPVVTNATNALYNTFKTPDYSRVNRLDRLAASAPGGSYTPVGGYLDYGITDRNYLLNQLRANSAATTRGLQASGINAGQAISGLMANNYLTQKSLADALYKADEINRKSKIDTATYNSNIDKSNSTMGIQAAGFDREKYKNMLDVYSKGIASRDAIDATRAAAIGNSISAVSKDLSNIGGEDYWRYVIDNNDAYTETTRGVRKNTKG